MAVFLRTGMATIDSGSWNTITLDRTYTSMVVICTPSYLNQTLPPMVARVHNASGNSFDLMVERLDGSSTVVSGVDVYYMVVEEGTYTVAADGVKMEAVKITSATVASGNLTGVGDDNFSTTFDNRSYANSYTTPIVLGQVMTSHDRWSVFYATRQNDEDNSPNSTACNICRHTGEDPDNTRSNETIGYVIFEQGGGQNIDGRAFHADRTPDGVTHGVYTDGFSPALSSASCAILSMNSIDGSDGCFAYFREDGGAIFSTNQIRMAVDEDDFYLAERSHTTEEVAYVVFAEEESSSSSSASCSSSTYVEIFSTHTPWSGTWDGKLFLQSGRFTSTLKTSQDPGAQGPMGLSWDETNTPWAGHLQKLFLQSGQFSATIKTSLDVSSWMPYSYTDCSGIDWDGADTPWSSTNSRLFLQSGQFSTTVKTSETPKATVCGDVSFDGVNTPWCESLGDAGIYKLHVTSGQFSTTLKTSLDVVSIDRVMGISWDGYNTPWGGTEMGGRKLYLTSGQFSTTLKDSQSILAWDYFPEGVSVNDVTNRLGVVPALSTSSLSTATSMSTLTSTSSSLSTMSSSTTVTESSFSSTGEDVRPRAAAETNTSGEPAGASETPTDPHRATEALTT